MFSLCVSVQKYAGRWTGYAKLPRGVIMCVVRFVVLTETTRILHLTSS